jgi:hypothetical protein
VRRLAVLLLLVAAAGCVRQRSSEREKSQDLLEPGQPDEFVELIAKLLEGAARNT